MGSGASTLLDNEEILLDQVTKLYSSNPQKWEDFFGKVRINSQNEILNNKEEKIITNNTTTNKDEISNNNLDNTSENITITSISKELCAEMSLLRENPLNYIKYLEKHLESFDDNDAKHDELIYKSNDNVLIQTVEGKSAVYEAIEVLKNIKIKLPPIKYDELHLEKAAYDHQKDMSKTGILGHDGSDKSTTKDRIERHCQWIGTIGENIDYGNMNARDIIVHLFIDDGVKSRGHQKNILNPEFLYAGAVIGSHPVYKYSCVTNFSGGIKSFNDIFTSDIIITSKSNEPPSLDLIKVLNSLPGDTTDLLNEVKIELQQGMEVTVNYKKSESTATIEYKDDKGIRITTMSWKAAAK